ncbi:ThuA domain-containing protein [Candidatus Enterococcus mangumiae]|uniref:ThuA-like domain-containing protein n=1 Tax=Candidatus Enterococcus mangumiae TaxID=2230878 RepID=A0ABZ2SUR3_9ENTE|nr:ThuA domain-containing protein [Enterococcus sp. DIV1094]MBO0488572.1 ThuA domain-containing protein [Enterococcus sp. DIV1094]
MKKIVTLLGDFYHPHDQLVDYFQGIVKKFPQELEMTDLTIDQLRKALQEQPDIFLLSKENRLAPETDQAVWLDETYDQLITEYVANGGSLIAHHSGLSNYPIHSTFHDMLGGRFIHHPKPTEVVYRDQKGLSYKIWDEHYFTEVDQAKTEVRLHSYSQSGESIAAWRHQYGKGSVFCITPAHFSEGLQHEATEKLLLEGIDWCLKLM